MEVFIIEITDDIINIFNGLSFCVPDMRVSVIIDPCLRKDSSGELEIYMFVCVSMWKSFCCWHWPFGI